MDKDWRDVFCGRSAELKQLIGAYEVVVNGAGPHLAVVCADRGMGKTRLVQELYRHLSTQCDPDDYWPDASLFKGNNLRVAPDFSDPLTKAHFASFTTAERPLPFLWWGFRLNDPLDRNAVNPDMSAHRRTLDPHLERARFAREHAIRHSALRHTAKDVAKDAALKIGEALLESVPGVGLGKNIIEVGLGVFKTARAHRDANREKEQFAGADLATLEAQRADDVYERTLDDLAALVQPLDGAIPIPTVVFCDDAQFAREGGDEGALRFLTRLWERAEQGGWPLLLVSTHWTVDWEQDRHSERASFARQFHMATGDRARATVVNLSKQSDLSALVDQGLPGLPHDDIALLLRKVDGNPQILIELVGLVQRSPAWRSRQGALSLLGRRAIERHHCNLTKLIIERLLSDVTPQEVRLAVALSSVQGMQFLGSLTEAAADALALGPAGEGLATAADPLRLVVGLDAGVASFVQRAYREAAESVLDTLCEPAEVKSAVLLAAIEAVEEPAQRAALTPDRRSAMLGVVVSLGSESAAPEIRLRAAQALLELIDVAADKAQKAAHARDFEAGLVTKWPLDTFPYEQLVAVRQALADWYGKGRTVELCERLVAWMRAETVANPSEEVSARFEQALQHEAEAHEARGDWNRGFLLLHERAESIRLRAVAAPTAHNLQMLCRALCSAAFSAESSTDHQASAAELIGQVVSIRRQQVLDQPSQTAHRVHLVDALLNQWNSMTKAGGVEVLREIATLRRTIAQDSSASEDVISLSDALWHLASDLVDLSQIDEASTVYDEAIAVLRNQCDERNDEPCRKQLACLLEELAQRCAKAGDLAGQRQRLLDALDTLSTVTDANVDPLDSFSLQQALARNAAITGDWEQAREYCLSAEASARCMGDADYVLETRRELAGMVPAGASWLTMEALEAEVDSAVRARLQTLERLRASFNDPATRSPGVCNDLAIALHGRLEKLCEAKLWSEAEQITVECMGVEGWARAEGVHQGAYTDADCAEALCYGLEHAGRTADALRLAHEMVRLRRAEACARGDEAALAVALVQASELAEACDDIALAAQWVAEWLVIERHTVERERDRNRIDHLLDPLKRLAGYAKRLNDWALHDAVEHERFAIGGQLWQFEGTYDDLIEAACGLAESAHGRGDHKVVAELAAQVAVTVRAVREQQGVACLLVLAPALARGASAWRTAGATPLQSEMEQLAVEFEAGCTRFSELQNAAVSLRNAGALDFAGPLQRRALELAVRQHGESSTEAASAYSALGRLLALQGLTAEAHQMYGSALTIREQLLGPDDEATVLVRERIAELCVES